MCSCLDWSVHLAVVGPAQTKPKLLREVTTYLPGLCSGNDWAAWAPKNARGDGEHPLWPRSGPDINVDWERTINKRKRLSDWFSEFGLLE